MKGTKLPSRHFIERKSVAVLCPCPRSLVLAHLLLIDDTLRAIDLPAARRSHALTDFDPLGLGESLEDWEERQEKTRIQPHADARARAVAEGRPTSGRAASVEQRDPALGIPGPLAHHLGLVQEGNPTGDNKIFQGPTRSGRVARWLTLPPDLQVKARPWVFRCIHAGVVRETEITHAKLLDLVRSTLERGEHRLALPSSGRS
jgi:hypothetical protein